MYEIPANNRRLNVRNNVVHGFFAVSGSSAPEDSFSIGEGINIIWVTLIGQGAGSAGTINNAYVGPSSNPYFQCNALTNTQVSGGAISGQFSSLGFTGMAGETTSAWRGGNTPLGFGAGLSITGSGYGWGGSDGATTGWGSSGWFWRVPLIVAPGMMIPYFSPGPQTGSGGGYVSFEW